MTTRRFIKLLFTLTVSASLSGCLGKTKFPTYYTLQLPPAVDPPAAEGARASVAVREFRCPAYLREGAIVYRPSPEEIGFYNFQRWAVDPREFLANALVDRLRASGKFSLVKFYDGRWDVDLILTGHLDKLEEVDYEDGVKVEAALSAQMMDLRSGKTVWADDASDSEEVGKRNVPAVVAEMDDAMNRAIQKLLDSLPASATLKPQSPPD